MGGEGGNQGQSPEVHVGSRATGGETRKKPARSRRRSSGEEAGKQETVSPTSGGGRVGEEHRASVPNSTRPHVIEMWPFIQCQGCL